MKILSLSIDQKIFEKDSAVRERMVDYGNSVDELHIVVYTNPGFKEERLSDNVFVYPTNTWLKPMYFLDALNRARSLFQRWEQFLVTSQYVYTSLLGIVLKWLHGIPLEVQIHGDVAHISWLHRTLYRLCAGQADCVRVVSEKIKKYVVEKWGIEEGRVAVLPIFVDIKHFRKADPQFNLHEKYPQFENIILMMSRLEPEKRIDRAIQAMEDVILQHPKTGLLIVGSGSLKNNLKKLTRRLGLEDNVVFEPWTDDTVSYYKGADMFLVTSEYEGYGMTIIEALASGLPVIATDVGVARDAGAYVVPLERIAGAIISQIEQGSKVAQLKNYPYKNEEEYFEKMVQTWRSCLSQS